MCSPQLRGFRPETGTRSNTWGVKLSGEQQVSNSCGCGFDSRHAHKRVQDCHRRMGTRMKLSEKEFEMYAFM